MMAAMSCALLTSGCAAMSGMRSFAVRMPPKYNSIPLSLKVAPPSSHSRNDGHNTYYIHGTLTFGRIMVAMATENTGCCTLSSRLPQGVSAAAAMWVVLTMIFPICIALVAL